MFDLIYLTSPFHGTYDGNMNAGISSKTAHAHMRVRNLKSVLNAIMQSDGLSRDRIMDLTGLSHGTVSEIITAPGISSPADICYAQPIDTLAIPNGNNTVTFVGFSSPTSILEPTQENGIVVAPNPINEHSSVTFQLTHTQPVKISVVDVSGKEILLHSENMSAGKHRVLLTGFDLAPGQYILKVIAGEQSGTQKIIVP